MTGKVHFDGTTSRPWRFAVLLAFIFTALIALSPIPITAYGRSPDRLQNGTPTATPVTEAKGQLLYRDGQTLNVIMTDGSAQATIATGTGFSALCPVLSHDGRQLAFVGGVSEFGLYIVPVTGGTPRALIKATPPKDTKTPAVDAPIGVPSWSPDGKTIAYTGQSGALYLVNVADGKQKAKLSTLKFFSADWSPDGKQFVAFAQSADNKAGIFTVNSDGSNGQSLVSLSDADATFALASDHFFARDTVLPRWSPDGKQITYAAIPSGGSVPSIYSIASGGGTTPTLISDPKAASYGASWSPDGKYLAYTTEDGDQRAITLIDLSQPRFGPIADLHTGGCPVWKPGK